MKLGPRLALSLLVAGVVPTALMGWLASSSSAAELERTARNEQGRRADELARALRRDVDAAVQALQLSVGLLPVDSLTPAELEQALSLPLHQVRGVEALLALDARGVALTRPLTSFELSEEALERFADAVPWRQALATGAAVGPLFAREGVPHVAVAVRLGGVGVVAADVALLDAVARFEAAARDGLAGALTDARGQALGTDAALGLELAEVVRPSRPGHPQVTAVGEAVPLLAAAARVTDLEWGVVLTRPLGEVLAPALRVRRYTAWWTLCGVVLALGLAAVLLRDILRPVRALELAATRLAAGNFEVALETEGRDELGALARAFATMVVEVRRRDGVIREWNETLQARVDERTRELREAHEQIARARRLAALSSLGAGFAHELNNPLTAVLGLTSLLRHDSLAADDQESLDEVMTQARRMMHIVERLISVSEAERGGALVVPLGDLVRSALARQTEALTARGVRIGCELPAGGASCAGDPMQLQTVVDALIDNAVQAMPRGGELHVSVREVEGHAVRLEVRDTGRGMSSAVRERIFDPFFTTKPSGTEVGLGLTVSHRIIENHHGTISVHSDEGHGATFTVVLPAAPAEAHLH